MTVFAARLIEKGRAEGRAEVRAEAIEAMMRKGYSKEDILDLGYTQAEYQEVEQKLIATSTV